MSRQTDGSRLPDLSEEVTRFGFRRGTWRAVMLLLFAILAVAGLFLSIAKGAADITPGQVWQILMNPQATPQDQIIWNIRLPRTIVGALVGVNLALSGAILQAILFPALEYLVTPVAFCGAMAAAVAIYILAWKNGIKPVRIILAGVAVSAFLSAGISGLLIFYSDRVNGALLWMVGGLAARSWPHVAIIAPYAAVGFVLALCSAHYLNILALGDDMAKGLGVHVEVTRVLLTAVAALLAASAVSVVGLLGFVGLVVPHMARLILGSDYRYLVPGAALLGIAIVTLSDTFARTVFAPVELPVGIIMALIGAPFFLFLLRREI